MKKGVDRWFPGKGEAEEEEDEEQNEEEEFTTPKVGGVRLNDEHTPICNLYTPPRKRPRNASTAASVKEEEYEEQHNSGPVSVTLAYPDVLDCPVCYQPLSSPVFQCENGHIACASCTTDLNHKCSDCSLPIGNIRNRAVEMILESVRVTCRYVPYGCAEMVSYNKKVEHESSCTYVPCSCPFSRCNFVGSSKLVYDHFASRHKDSSKQFFFNSTISISMISTEKHLILREKKGGVLFVLNRCIRLLGNFCNVVCVAPSASEERFVYELTAIIGEDLVKVKRCVEMMPKWTRQPFAEMSLVVPSSLIGSSQILKLDLIIRKKSASAN